MGNKTLVIITFTILTIVFIIGLICFIRSRKTKRIKKALSDLEIEKNKIDSSPIIPELAKIEAFLNNEKLEIMYNEWTMRLQKLKMSKCLN